MWGSSWTVTSLSRKRCVLVLNHINIQADKPKKHGEYRFTIPPTVSHQTTLPTISFFTTHNTTCTIFLLHPQETHILGPHSHSQQAVHPHHQAIYLHLHGMAWYRVCWTCRYISFASSYLFPYAMCSEWNATISADCTMAKMMTTTPNNLKTLVLMYPLPP